jgi:hypothetical protein
MDRKVQNIQVYQVCCGKMLRELSQWAPEKMMHWGVVLTILQSCQSDDPTM